VDAGAGVGVDVGVGKGDICIVVSYPNTRRVQTETGNP